GEAGLGQSRNCGDDGEAQFQSAGRVLDHGCTRARPGLRSDVRLRSGEGGRGVLRGGQAVLRLRPGILPRRAREDEFSLQPRLRRSILAASAAAAAGIQRGLFTTLTMHPPALALMDYVAPAIAALIFVLVMSLVSEPARRT